MTYCDEYVELIGAAIDGALSPQEQARLEEHLNTCPACKALYDDLDRVHQALLELPPVEVPEGLTDRILETVAADNITALPKPKKSAFQWKRTLAAAAVFALVLLGTGTLRGQLNATKEAAPENFMPQLYSNEADEVAPMIAVRSSEGIFDEEEQVPAQGCQEVSDPTNWTTDAVSTSQGAAKQSPASSPEVQPPEPQPTQVPEPTVDITGSLSVLPASGESPEGTDFEIPVEGAPEEPGEALSLLVEFLWSEKIPEGMQRVDTEEFFGCATPLVSQDGEEHSQQVSIRLEYLGLTPNGKYHEFWLHSFLLDDPETGLAHSSTLNFFAVPLDGGEILVQRQEIDLPDGTDKTDDIDEIMELYLAGIDAYHEAISN